MTGTRFRRRVAALACIATTAATVGTLAATQEAASASPLGNGSFETPAVPDPPLFENLVAGSHLGAWTVTRSGVKLTRDLWHQIDGHQNINLSSVDGDGEIYQTVDTLVGQDYVVGFWLTRDFGLGDSTSVAVTVDGAPAGTFTHDAPGWTSEDPLWQHHELRFAATGASTSLCLASGAPTGGIGPIIDAVTVDVVAPVARDDSFTVAEGGMLTMTRDEPFANDDIADPTMSFPQVVHPPARFFIRQPSGDYEYYPGLDPVTGHVSPEAAGFCGTDSFTYQVVGLAGPSNVATVRITTTCANDGPDAVDGTYTTDEDTPLVIGGAGVLENDTDADGDGLVASVDDGPDHGALVLHPDGTFTYTPALDYCGPDRFSYTASDGAATDAATVEIAPVRCINDAPRAVADGYTIPEGSRLTVGAPGVLGNDTDVDAGGPPGHAVLGSGTGHGSLHLAADGSFTYDPAAGFVGTDTFTYAAQDADGAASPLVTASIVVTDVADPVVLGAKPIVLRVGPGLQLSIGKLEATLQTTGGAPLAGRPISFSAGGALLCTATTNAQGIARCDGLITYARAVLNLRYTATFAGDPTHRPASAPGPIAVILGVALF